MHQLKIDFSEFEFAFDSRRDLLSFYLDSETGEIFSVSEEDQYYEAFITTVSNARIREQLNQAISGRGAFRSFKNILLQHPTERQCWLQYKRDCLHQFILERLEEHGIEPIPCNEAGNPG